MTAKRTTTERNQERIDWEDQQVSEELRQLGDMDLSLAVEDEKQAVRSGADSVEKALLNEDVPLTDEKVSDLWTAAERLASIAGVLCERIPEEHRSYK